MELKELRNSLANSVPPDDLGSLVRALWHDAKGNWSLAHEIVQDESGPDAAWVHAYLHRKEGDLANAGYWYRRAGKPLTQKTLEEEWDELAAALL